VFWITIPLTVFVVIVQLTVAPSLRVLGVHADLAIVWLGCYAAVRPSAADVLPLIMTAGLTLGLSGAEPFGASLLALLPLAGLVLAKDIVPLPSRYIAALIIVGVGGFCYTLFQPLAAVAAGVGLGPPLNLVRVAPRAAVVDTLTALVWFWPIRLLFAARPTLGSFRRA
jgi:hypothetical protein